MLQLNEDQLTYWSIREAFATPLQLRTKLQNQPLEWTAFVKENLQPTAEDYRYLQGERIDRENDE
eukprot:354992-Prorocentrum_lima.AAC.1